MVDRKVTANRIVAAQTLLDSVQGFYVAEALFQLLQAGVLSHLQKPHSSKEIADSLALCQKTLRDFLDFVSRCSDVIQVDKKGRYRLGAYPTETLYFQLEKFVGCYGPSIRGLANLLQGGKGNEPSQAALARAFASVRAGNDLMISVLTRAQVFTLLDLGCGTGSLLVDMAMKNPRFEGYGFDSNRDMYTVGVTRVRKAGLTRRVHIKCADARKARKILGSKRAASIDALCGRSFLNQFFMNGGETVGKVLRALRRSFPGRNAWFVDYYGELPARHNFEDSRLGLLQDACQIVSGQGIPPADRDQWRDIYREAGCTLTDSEDFQSDGIRWFIHQVLL